MSPAPGPAAAPRIALIHAMLPSFEPAHAAFATAWPEARLANLLDDTLLGDLEAEGRLGPAMNERFASLAAHAWRSGAEAVLFTCSAFGPAIEHAASQVPIPVLKPNEAMFEAALRAGDDIAMLATGTTAARSLETEFRATARRRGVAPRLTVVVEPRAMAALRQADAETHNRLLAERAAGLACEVIMLAHFSTSRAAATVGLVTSAKVLTAPDTAVAELKRRLGDVATGETVTPAKAGIH